MDPTTGTFLSVDPLVPAYDDPQFLNAYAYSRNNPLSYRDPSGMYPELPGYYWVNSHVSSDGMSVTNVFTNSAEAAGAAWFGPLDAGSFLGSSPSSSIGGFTGLSSVSLSDVGGASLAGLGALGGLGAGTQSASPAASNVASPAPASVADAPGTQMVPGISDSEALGATALYTDAMAEGMKETPTDGSRIMKRVSRRAGALAIGASIKEGVDASARGDSAGANKAAKLTALGVVGFVAGGPLGYAIGAFGIADAVGAFDSD